MKKVQIYLEDDLFSPEVAEGITVAASIRRRRDDAGLGVVLMRECEMHESSAFAAWTGHEARTRGLVLAAVFAFLGSCGGPGECPDPDRRFQPGMGIEETFESFEDSNSPQCPGGVRFDNGGETTLMSCDSTWCVDGYDGEYCEIIVDLEAWLAVDCPGCEANSYYKEGKTSLFSVYCELDP